VNKFGFDITEEKRLYYEGIRLFNEAEYFAAHDEWEEVWTLVQDKRREQYYRSIIKGAVSLVLLQSGRAVGARQVFVDCVDEFEGLPPVFMGLDIPKHIERLRHALQPAIEDLEARKVVIDPSRLFKIELLYDPFETAPNGEGTA
jgi:hypothetical protein